MLWQGGKRASAEGGAASAAAGRERSGPAASAAAVPKARPQGGDIASSCRGELSLCLGGPRKKRPCRRRGEVMPKAARVKPQNKLIVIKPPKEKSPAGALFIIVRMHSVKARVFTVVNLPLTLDGLFRVPFC